MVQRDTTNVDRRSLMKNAGAMAGAASLIGIAGCADDASDDGSGTGDENGAGAPVPEFEFASYTVEEDPIRYETAVLATDMWEELGFEVNHNPMEIGAILDMTFDQLEHETMGVRRGGQPHRLDPDFFLYNAFHSSGAAEGGNPHISGYVSDEYDAAVEAQREEFDIDARREHVYECQEILARDVPEIQVMMQYRIMPLNTERFTNENANMPGTGLFGFWNFHEIEPASSDVERLRFGYPGGDVQSMNPWVPFPTQDVNMMNIIYDRLVGIAPDGSWEPWALDEISRIDGSTLDVSLRDGMQWHDGEDVTVSDLIFTLEYGMEHGGGEAYNMIDSVEEGGDLDVRIHLTGDIAPFEITGLGTIWLAPEHVWGDVDDPFSVEDIDRTASGIYQFEYWDVGEEMGLTRFDDHWNPANVPELTWVAASGMSPLLRALTQEDLDMIVWSLGLDQIDEVEEADFLDTYRIGDMAHHIISMNGNMEMFQDRALRRALATAVPEEDIMEVTLGGLEANGGYAEHNYAPITPANEFWHNPDIPEEHRWSFDLDAARQILEDAGYWWDDDGRIHYPE